MGAISRTRATTTASRPLPTCFMPSTTRPRSSRVSAREEGSPSKGAKSRSHDKGTSTDVSDLPEEADVVLEQDPHVGDLVAHLGAPVDPETEGEARPFLVVDT